MASDNRQHIVIVGGGAAGAAVAKDLVPSLNPATHTLTVITSRPYFIDLPAMARTVVTSDGALLMPYGDAFVAQTPYPSGSGKFTATIKIGKAIGFTSEESGKGGGDVLLEGGEKISYSVLILATGSTWNGPLDIPEADSEAAKAHLDSWRHKFSNAKNVVLIGGGAVGLELAGEIRDFYPDTKVTIVHRDSELFNAGYPSRFRRAALRRIQQAGAEVILDDSLEQLEPSSTGTVTTVKGKVIQADLVVPCWGGRPNTSIISTSLGAHILTASGHVKVDPTLQVQGYPRIFAGGDIIDWDEQRQAVKATKGHSPVAVANIISLTSGMETRKIYKGSSELIALVVGRSGGLIYFELFWGIGVILADMLGDFVMRTIKSKGLLIEFIRKQYGFGNFRS
ncbi:hypothetical protein BKA70DRAFT_1255135 [Coprinopsis sp. MPI-PUGE-AT-0042]|nr:hypothetical protein BKA70DRAFT_1255135 [Coprinopsis sp. MPI-PUGE-AT-0042]